MAKNYYSLVAGLREYALEGEHKGFDAHYIIEEILEELSSSDTKSLKLLYTYYDVENIINLKSGRGKGSGVGNIPYEELEEELKSPSKLPKELADLILAYADSTHSDDFDLSINFEKALLNRYYQLCRESKCRFLIEWGEFDRNLRNVCAAYTARRLALPIADYVVGDGYIVDALVRSSAADFGLKGEVEYIDLIMTAIAAEGNMIGKEHKIDNIRWTMSDELTTFDYFNINTLLAYLVKVNIIHRWVSLDRAKGQSMLRKLIDSFDEIELIKGAGSEE